MSNIEYLTKTQIVLLTLFVSFVASMATGIVVVTLMQQSPEPVTQTLTKVVERTIEKITSSPSGSLSTPAPIKDEDLMVAAIDRNIKSTVAFKVASTEGDSRSAGVGTIVTADGLVITDTGNFGQGILTTTIGGIQYALQVVSNDKSNTLGLGRLVPTGTATTTVTTFTPVAFGNADALKLGQTAIVIGGWDAHTILSGFINNLQTHIVTDKDKKTETKVLDDIGVSVHPSAVSSGAPIINLNGEVIGFLSINENAGTQSGIPVSEARRILDLALKPAPAPTKVAQ
jgi:S1-C subfamily serine protease